MEIINGSFHGTIFASKGECVDIRWKKAKHGSPKNDTENKLSLTYYKNKDEFMDRVGGVEFLEVSPKYIVDESSSCLWNPPFSGFIEIKFKHTSPKKNTLFLYDMKQNQQRIKLKVKGDAFYGRKFVEKGKCIDFRWKKSKHRSPNTIEENKIFFRYLDNKIIPNIN